MKRLFGVLGVVLLLGVCPAWALGPVIPGDCRQVLLAVSDDWNATTGALQRFERADSDETWRTVGMSVSVDLGRSGLGWGLGLHPMPTDPGPVKAEGDGRAPAGVFDLTRVFAAEPVEVEGTGLPVVVVTEDLVCVDDQKSDHYNTMFSPGADQIVNWSSAETMLRPDGIYRFGVFVAHNANPPRPGAGSCIFMHIRHADGSPTSGCTAMEAVRLREIIQWLRPGVVLVQLPKAEYERLALAWGLPGQ